MSCQPFADLAPCSSASCIDLQLAIAGEFGPADLAATRGTLDDFARPLFGLTSSEPQTQADALLRLMADDQHFTADHGGDPEELLLPRVVETRRGHPLMLAIIARELACRAGIATTVYSSPTRWFVGLQDEEHVLLLDAGLQDGLGDPRQLRAHCRHELAFCTLTGLSRSFADRSQLQRARRATRLKLALPINDPLRADVERELDALNRIQTRHDGPRAQLAAVHACARGRHRRRGLA